MPPAEDEPSSESFTFRDRRRTSVSADAPATSPETPAATPAAPPTAAADPADTAGGTMDQTPTDQMSDTGDEAGGTISASDEAAMNAMLANMSEAELEQVAAAMGVPAEALKAHAASLAIGGGDGSSATADAAAGMDEGNAGELPDVYSVLALFLGELRNLAWLRMGLVANPGTGQIERDMAQAKVAIDTVAFLAQQIEPYVPAQERLPLRALVSDLQMNFVEQSKRNG
jgi:hypothetical protein